MSEKIHQVYRLYEEPPQPGMFDLAEMANDVFVRQPDYRCTLCTLHRRAEEAGVTGQIRPTGLRGEDDGDKRVLYVMFSSPTRVGSKAGHWAGQAEKWAIEQIRARWKGPIILDYAIRCWPTGTISPSHVDKCRYNAVAVADALPDSVDRAIFIGKEACKVGLGTSRGSAVHANRRGYMWVYGDEKSKFPAFMMMNATQVRGNKFLAKDWVADLEWALGTNPPKPPLDAVLLTVPANKWATKRVQGHFRGVAFAALDIEAYGQQGDDDYEVLSVGVTGVMPDGRVLSPMVWPPGFSDNEDQVAALMWFLRDSGIKVSAQNGKYDHIGLLLAFGQGIDNFAYDTRLMFKAMQSNGVAGLSELADLIGMGGHKDESAEYVKYNKAEYRKQWKLDNPGKSGRLCRAGAYAYKDMPAEVNMRYVALDSLTTAMLTSKLLVDLDAAGLSPAYFNTIHPASKALSHVEMRGANVDRDTLLSTAADLTLMLDDVRQQLAEKYPDVDPNSSDSIASLLYEDLGITPFAFTKTGKPSTTKGVLKRLKTRHTAPQLILEYRKLSKLISTYATGLEASIRDDGRVHPTYLVDGTETGRLSCAAPNLQNIPTRTAEGKWIKSAFVGTERDGTPGVLIQADYSTLEIRVAAYLSGDDAMVAALKGEIDFHTATAMKISYIWGLTPEEVYHEIKVAESPRGAVMRATSKTINFGTLYGQSPPALADGISAATGTKLTTKQAEQAQQAIFSAYPKLARWIEKQKEHVRRHGEVWTTWEGKPWRRRLLSAAGYQDSGRGGTAIRSSYNTPVQGTGSDFTTMSIAELDKTLPMVFGDDAWIVLTVHDSIVVDVTADPDIIRDVIDEMRDVMTGWDLGDVPIEVDFEIGFDWGHLENADDFLGRLDRVGGDARLMKELRHG